MAIPFPEIDPNAFVIPGLGLPIRWYALAYIAGLVAGWQIIVALMKRPALWGGTAPMAPARVEDLLTAVIVGVILGGRLGYVLFYQPGYYLTHPLEILKIWEGGMAFHGGFLGVVLAGVWFARRHRIAPLALADAFALVAPVGLLLGRVANFIKPELWGRPTDAPWGRDFPAARGAGLRRHRRADRRCSRAPCLAALRGGAGGAAAGRDPLGAAGAGRAALPLLLGVFLAGYGAARAFVELFRQPDAQFASPDNPLGYALQLGGAGLTMGQILSIPMIAAGLWFVWRARRLPRRKEGDGGAA
ncbi:MAG: prolipoprotein diacylglyceryl transferase [Paracoccaceae bacterium]